MRILLVAAVLALMAGAAHAQFRPSVNLMQEGPKDEAAEQRRKDIERYRALISRLGLRR